MIPVAGTIIYTEPLFISATGSSALPQLQRVITAWGKRVAMAPTLEESLKDLFAPQKEEPAPAPAAPAKGPPAAKPVASDLARQALDHYQAAQQAVQSGDWTEYGRQLELMQKALEAMQKPASDGGK